jgi:hypothetical protein
MVIKNITHDIVTNSNITQILFIIFRYHTVDCLLKMSDILKMEYDLTLTLTALLPPKTPHCCQACHHCPQGCSHAATLVAGAPAIAAALVPRCPLRVPHCHHYCAAAAATTLPPPCCHCRCTASATVLPSLPHFHRRVSCSNAATAILAVLPLPPMLHCCQVAALTAKLPPPPPRLLLRCYAAATTAATELLLPLSCHRH